jgi:hypothetical protein
MTAKERVLAIRVAEKARRQSGSAARAGVVVREKEVEIRLTYLKIKKP